MSSDCIFFIEDHDMGATIPFCVFERSSKWNCCEYYDHRDSAQELCPHYISSEDARERLRKSFIEEAGVHRRMTRREKWMSKVISDDTIEDVICQSFVKPFIDEACPGCPLGSLCRSYVNGERTYEQYMEAVSKWLDEEVKDDGSV